MRNLTTLLFALLLAGCTTTPQQTVPQVVVQTKVVKSKIPAEYFVLPPAVPKLNTDTATQKDVAKWLVDVDKRMDALELKLDAIKEFNDRE